MPANEFEKQVQQRMDEFQLNPSASVWERVEDELRNKRKRRVIFFFILAAMIGLLGFSVYYLSYSGKKTELADKHTDNKEATLANPSSPADKNNSPHKAQTTTTSSNGTIQPAEAGKENLEGNQQVIGNNRLNISYPVTKTRRINIERPAKRMQMTETATPANNKANPTSDKSGEEKNVPMVAQPSTRVIPKTDTKEPAATDNKAGKQTDNSRVLSKDSAATKTDSLAAAIVKTTNNKKPKSKKLSKVKWGINAFAGASFVQSGMFAWKGMQFGPMSYPGSAAYPATSPGGPVNPRSDVKPGFSFSIGVSGEWKISDRSSFSTGLLYHYASNRIKVGSAMDTTLQNPSNFNSFQRYTIYHGVPTEDHTNSYHFISLPLEYHHLLSRKIQLQWDLGVAINYLLATNALIYTQSYGGIYYEDKDAFFKTHCAARTGLSFRLKSKNGMEWVTGPEISFDMTRLLKNDQNKEYLFFTGLNTKIYFPKKKAK